MAELSSHYIIRLVYFALYYAVFFFHAMCHSLIGVQLFLCPTVMSGKTTQTNGLILNVITRSVKCVDCILSPRTTFFSVTVNPKSGSRTFPREG